MSGQTWIVELSALRAAGTPCCVVVVTDVQGSAPRESGTRMIVTGGGLHWGTIGGGNLEKQAIEHARELLGREEAVTESVDVPLAESAGQCCGGRVTLFYETFPWRARRVAVFGAGHVGQALAGLSRWMRAQVLVIDGRTEDEIEPGLPAERDWELRCIDEPEAEIDTLPADTLVCIMTHSHALDLAVLERALTRGGFPFVGLIGSDRKWSRFRKRLLAKGFPEATLASVHCPIGVTRGSKEPGAIALSTATQLVEVLAALEAGPSPSLTKPRP